MEEELDITKIPQGPYCYTYINDKYVHCPYAESINDEGVVLPFCTFLKQGGTSNYTTDEEFEILVKKYGSDDEVWKKYPLDLLWDSVKECGENCDYRNESDEI